MIAIADYGLGNMASVARAMKAIGHPAEVTGAPEAIAKASKIVLPGVGAFAAGMANLTTRGLAEPIVAHIKAGRPLLGICLGLQLLMEESEEGTPEDPRPRGLGLFPGSVRLLPGPSKVPQIGWNCLSVKSAHSYLSQVDGEYFYFVHSYYVDPVDRSLIVAETDYDIAFAAALGRDNVLAVQFHPEKSGSAGLRLLRAFCEAP